MKTKLASAFSFRTSAFAALSAILFCLGMLPAFAQSGNTLGATALLEGPGAGSDSVVLAANTSWTATTNDTWLHLSAANQSGTGSANVVFSYDANPGGTRTGTLTIAGQTLTVTQAGSRYVRAPSPVTALVSSGLSYPTGLAVDGAGNVYIADYLNNAIKEWVAASNTVITLVSSGLNEPSGVAVDGAGNVYIADYGNNAIKEWVAANHTVVTLVSSGLNEPFGVAVDGAGNVYIADYGNNAIEKWVAANNTVSTLASGLNGPNGVAVDGAGNVYIADYNDNKIQEWVAASNTVSTLASGLNGPNDVAVDGAGNVYIADSGNNAIKELPRAFVNPTARWESPAAGSDVLPVVLPATENLRAPFAPTSDQSWLTLTSVTNGVVNFDFTGNTGNSSRTAHITLLGQSIPVTQLSLYSLGATALLEGPGAGSDSVVLAVNTPNGPWTATANDTWLHLSAANQSGTGSANVVFSYDANPGGTRTGTLTIAGQTLAVTQAGSSYVRVPDPFTDLPLFLGVSPSGVAVDGAGNVYVADYGDNLIQELAASNTNITLVSSGLNGPNDVAVDGAGNVYIADSGNNAIKEWLAANHTVVTLVSSGLNKPASVAVDGADNVYIADSGNNAIKEWVAASNTVITLVSSGLNEPYGVAVDGAGNVYIADYGDNAIKEWVAANHTVVTLVSSGLNEPFGVAVDGAGNVYIADFGFGSTNNSAIKEWVAANQTVVTLASSGLGYPQGVAVDGAGNVYIADPGNGVLQELPRAFVDPTAKWEGLAAGSDVLPVVLPATENLRAPFAPTNDQPWLTITSVNNGVVSYDFTADTNGASRTAHITLLGQSIPITQAAPPTLIGPTIPGNGQFQFTFSNAVAGASFTVLTSTNLALPLAGWTVAGTFTNSAPGWLQFNVPMTNDVQRFYRVRSP